MISHEEGKKLDTRKDKMTGTQVTRMKGQDKK